MKLLTFAPLVLLACAPMFGGTITVLTTPFSGTTTDFVAVWTAAGADVELPYTDADNRTVDADDHFYSRILSTGLQLSSSNQTVGATFSGLASGTTSIGFVVVDQAFPGGHSAGNFISIAFDNGDSYTGSFSPTDTFLGFFDTTPFTSVTLTFESAQGDAGSLITSFTTAADTGVPEPSSFALFGLGALVLGAAARRKS